MGNLVGTTGIGKKYDSPQLTLEEVNALNGTVNNMVPEVNNMLRNFCNVNMEELPEDPWKEMTLSEAIKKVRLARRASGMKVRFIEKGHGWTEYEYTAIGPVTNIEWEKPENWRKTGADRKIDGGTF